jgi:ERCC4-related helicase
LRKNCEYLQAEISQLYKYLNELKEMYKRGSAKMTEELQKSRAIRELEEAETKRRQHFNLKLFGIQEQVKEILKEEENSRIGFLTEVLGHEETYENAVLANIRVPCFLLNFDETTDNELSM